MSELDAINESIEHSKKAIKTAEAVNRLRSNPDFKAVIVEGYMRDYASELVMSKAEVHTQNDEAQKYIDRQIIAIGAFPVYMNLLLTMGVTAQAALEAQEEELTMMISEEGY